MWNGRDQPLHMECDLIHDLVCPRACLLTSLSVCFGLAGGALSWQVLSEPFFRSVASGQNVKNTVTTYRSQAVMCSVLAVPGRVLLDVLRSHGSSGFKLTACPLIIILTRPHSHIHHTACCKLGSSHIHRGCTCTVHILRIFTVMQQPGL